MSEMEISGGAPQSSPPDAPGVSLTRPERAFLTRLIDPFADAPDRTKPYHDRGFARIGRAALLREEDVKFLLEWVLCQGVHWLSCEEAELDPLEGARAFRNPAVRRIINAAAEQGFCVGTSALKEEVEDFFTQRMRNPFLPEAVKDNAADKLAKLKGYYPDGSGKGGGNAAVQINITNPYAKPEVVVHEEN